MELVCAKSPRSCRGDGGLRMLKFTVYVGSRGEEVPCIGSPFRFQGLRAQ